MAECVYCKSEVPSNVYKVCELPASTLYLFREQTHYGRCVVVERGHHKELFELSDGELAAYMRDVSAVAKAMDQQTAGEVTLENILAADRAARDFVAAGM